MNTAFKSLIWALLPLAASMAAIAPSVAQESTAAPASPAAAPGPTPAAPAAGAAKNPSKSTAQIDAGEPRADTSPTSRSSSETAGASSATRHPTAGSPPGSGASQARPGASSRPTSGGTDRLSLGTATVTGDREQPKVMYIVPWKKSDIGDGSGKPMNSLLDEALAPVDRDEFKREVAYFDAVTADTPQKGAPDPASKRGEK